MKQSKTTLKELTAAYRAVLRHGVLCNAIALGLVAMPAVAIDYDAFKTSVEAGDNVTFSDDLILSGAIGNSIAANSADAQVIDLTGYTIDGDEGSLAKNLIQATGADLTIKGGEIKNLNRTTEWGSAVHLTGAGNLTIDGTDFTNNHSVTAGALSVGTAADTMYIKNSTFSGNTANQVGAVGLFRAATFEDVVFEDNHATVSEGAYGTGALFLGSVSKAGFSNKVTGSKFENNTSAGRAGAIGMRDFSLGDNKDGTLDIESTKFINNVAATNGGAIDNYFYNDAANDGYAKITNSEFTENKAEKGGAIYNHIGKDGEILSQGQQQIGKMHFENTSFTGNTATKDGGAIYNEGTLNVHDSTFESNKSNGGFGGGAIFTSSKLNVYDSSFTGNESTDGWGGGAIRFDVLDGTESSINNSVFTSNKAHNGDDADSGAIAIRNGDVVINDSKFITNEAEYGGAIYAYTGNNHYVKTMITNGLFNKNTALSGGAIVNLASTRNNSEAGMFITGSTFKDNTATDVDDEGGAAIFLGSESITSISGSAFNHNVSAASGGAIATRVAENANSTKNDNSGARLDIIGTKFYSNVAATTGGVIDNYFYGSTNKPGSVYVNNAEFGLNSAANGGVVYNHNQTDLNGNGGYITFSNSKFVNNTASENGGAIYNESVVDLAGVNVFNGNTANGNPNDIHNLGALNIASGTTSVAGGITGNTGTLTVNENATLNIGTASVAQKTISLEGNMFATLRDGEAQITAESFEGDGTLNLTMAKAGTYHVFGGDAFEKLVWNDKGLTFDDLNENALYKLEWSEDGKDVTATTKTADEIATGTGLAGDTLVAVSHVAEAASSSDSVQLQNLSVKLQEKLASGDTVAVEHATKAVHPETESVKQSVSSSVQNTVVNLAASRMSAPRTGRNGGDAKLTSGGVWVQGLFNKSKHSDTFNGYTRGIALGLDGTINRRWTIGAGYSYAHSDINGTARTTEVDSNTLFLYGQYKPSQWYLNAIANYTMSDYSEKGTVIDNTPIFGDYSVDSFGGALATGYDFRNGITPELGLRYMHVNANDYANSYGIKTYMNASDFLTGIVGAKYAFKVVANKYTTYMPQLNAGLKYDMLSDANIATVTMPGVNAYTLDGGRLNRVGGEFGIGLGIRHGNLEVSVNYDIDVRKDYTSQTGMLKLRANF